MEASILDSTKQILNVDVSDTTFDLDILTHINSAFFDLNTLGVGPIEGFFVEDNSAEWTDFLVPAIDRSAVRTLVFLKVRLLFDPPATSFHIQAIQDEIAKFEWKLNVNRENALIAAAQEGAIP